MAKLHKHRVFTCNQVAVKLNLTPGRIRQICNLSHKTRRRKNIGSKLGDSRAWVLTKEDIDAIRSLPDQRRKRRKQ